MKKILFTLSVCLLAIGTMAQDDVSYRTADGKLIPKDKVDSVMKALGVFSMVHKKDQPGVVFLFPESGTAQKKEAQTEKMNAMIGKPAPHFKLTDVKGKVYDLALLKNKVIVLNFWFISCPPCIAEMPDLNRLKAAYSAKDVLFLGLAIDDENAIQEFLKTRDFQYAIVPGSGKTHKDYGIVSCPVSLVIDRKGVVRFVSSGSKDVKGLLPRAITAAVEASDATPGTANNAAGGKG